MKPLDPDEISKVGSLVQHAVTNDYGVYVSKGPKRTRVIVEHKTIKGCHDYSSWKNEDALPPCRPGLNRSTPTTT